MWRGFFPPLLSFFQILNFLFLNVGVGSCGLRFVLLLGPKIAPRQVQVYTWTQVTSQPKHRGPQTHQLQQKVLVSVDFLSSCFLMSKKIYLQSPKYKQYGGGLWNWISHSSWVLPSVSELWSKEKLSEANTTRWAWKYSNKTCPKSVILTLVSYLKLICASLVQLGVLDAGNML